MTPAAFFTELQRRGVRLEARGDRLHVEAPAGVLTEAEKAQLRALKLEVMRLLAEGEAAVSFWPDALHGHPRRIGAFTPCAACGAGTWASYAGLPLCRGCANSRGRDFVSLADQYRALLRQGFALIARGADASREACALFLTEQARFADELGPDLAQAIGRETARGWWTDTGRCPWCGEPGEFHEGQA